MSTPKTTDLSGLSDPALAALLCAVDPFGLGGVALRTRAGPLRDRWLALLRGLLPIDTPWRRLPVGTGDGRLFGGLDLTATLETGRPIAERGLLVETDGGLLLIAMAERLPASLAARLGAVLDSGAVAVQRDGLADRRPARIGMVALDEGIEDDEQLPPALLERLALRSGLDGFDPTTTLPNGASIVAEARLRLPAVHCGDEALAVLAETALALGAESLRASVLALRAARAVAALGDHPIVALEDAAIAARLVLAPRATRLPAEREAEHDGPTEPVTDQAREHVEPDAEAQSDREETNEEAKIDQPLGDVVLAAAKAAIPPGLLLQLQAAAAASRAGRPSAAGRAGAMQSSPKRGRPAGLRRGIPTGGARLNVIETLRAAAPWQRLRTRAPETRATDAGRHIEVRRDDLRITRFKQKTENVTIFVVDASGSLALNRLAEAKGAVELLLAECYVRRDQVALIAFRGQTAEVLLPPTRSLTRAKRSLAELAGGGATPLALGIDAAMLIANQVRRRGQTPLVVFLTDGRANVARDGTTGRAHAEADARLAAQAAGASGTRILVVDAAQRPQPPARGLAAAMNALYLPLPRAQAASLSAAVQTASKV